MSEQQHVLINLDAPLPPPIDGVPLTQRRALAAVALACEKLLSGCGTEATVELQRTLEPLAAADDVLRDLLLGMTPSEYGNNFDVQGAPIARLTPIRKFLETMIKGGERGAKLVKHLPMESTTGP